MKLKRISERIWILPHEEYRDRPALGYIRGDRWSIAVDAGHSADHTGLFYRTLEVASLPLPALTILTHWHWDHTFGMHSVRGLCIANEKTNRNLEEIRDRIRSEGSEFFLAMDQTILNEYAGNRPVIVTLADLIFSGELNLNAGNCPVRIFQTESPHTDDSSLVHIPGEKVLFMGDAAYGAFPTWESDPLKCSSLAGTVRQIDADVCVGSHHDPCSRDELIRDFLTKV